MRKLVGESPRRSSTPSHLGLQPSRKSSRSLLQNYLIHTIYEGERGSHVVLDPWHWWDHWHLQELGLVCSCNHCWLLPCHLPWPPHRHDLRPLVPLWWPNFFIRSDKWGNCQPGVNSWIMFVNVSTVVAAGVMIVVPFIQEVKSIVVELGRDKSKVWFQKTKYFLLVFILFNLSLYVVPKFNSLLKLSFWHRLVFLAFLISGWRHLAAPVDFQTCWWIRGKTQRIW